MKRILFLCLMGAVLSLTSCQSKTTKAEAAKQSTQVETTKTQAPMEVYYFHGDRRCTTCKAVGTIAQQTVAVLIANKKEIKFYDINLDNQENISLAKEFEATGSGLYIKNNTTGDIKNITKFAFMNAVQNPDALKAKIKNLVKMEQ